MLGKVLFQGFTKQVNTINRRDFKLFNGFFTPLTYALASMWVQ